MKKSLDKLAFIISLVFEPRLEIPILLLLAVRQAWRDGAAWPFLVLLLLVDVGLPLLFYVHLRLKGEISHWDIVKRQERVPLYVFFTIAQLAGVGLSWLFGQKDLTNVLLVFFILAAMFTLVTAVWKVSIHSGVNAAMATYLWATAHSLAGWMVGVVVLVAWARVRLKRHGLPQVVVGGLLGALGMLGGMRLVGL